MQEIVSVSSREEIADGLYVVRFQSERIAQLAQPGQFVNIRVADSFTPFLRRPFSVSRVEGIHVEIVFNIVGIGTRLLSMLRSGDTLDVVGPLGVPFGYRGDFTTALLIAGGLGVAPFPLLTSRLQSEEKHIVSFVGARSAYQLYRMHLKNPHYATDDGSAGMKGTVVDLLEHFLKNHQVQKPKIFGCGPTKMLKALSDYAQTNAIPCELSLEGDMACGIGLCQGCPVERVGGSNGKKKYALVCTEGPSFQCQDIILS